MQCAFKCGPPSNPAPPADIATVHAASEAGAEGDDPSSAGGGGDRGHPDGLEDARGILKGRRGGHEGAVRNVSRLQARAAGLVSHGSRVMRDERARLAGDGESALSRERLFVVGVVVRILLNPLRLESFVHV